MPAPSKNISLSLCTKDEIPVFFNTIAELNSRPTQLCLLTSTTAEAVRNDFVFFNADPTQRLWGARDSRGALIAVAGLDIDVSPPQAHFFGPWARDEADIPQVLAEIMRVAPGRDVIEKFRGWHSVTALPVIAALEAAGFGNKSWGTVLFINKASECPPARVTAAAAGSCARVLASLDGADAPWHAAARAIHDSLWPESHIRDEVWATLDGSEGWMFVCFPPASPAAEATTPVGYAIVQKQGDSNEIYVHYVGVAKSEQGKGFGTVLLAAVRDWFLESPYEKLFLNVDGDNKNARKVYMNVGFAVETEGVGHTLLRSD